MREAEALLVCFHTHVGLHHSRAHNVFADMLLNEQSVEGGRSHEELQDIASTWGAPWCQDPTAGHGYPILQWQYDRGDYRDICGFDPDSDPTRLVALPQRESEDGAFIYNLSGQRLQKMQRGINIVGGKKIIVK